MLSPYEFFECLEVLPGNGESLIAALQPGGVVATEFCGDGPDIVDIDDGAFVDLDEPLAAQSGCEFVEFLFALVPAGVCDGVRPALRGLEVADVRRVDEEAFVFVLQDQLSEGRRVVQRGEDLPSLFALRVSPEDDLQFLVGNVF